MHDGHIPRRDFLRTVPAGVLGTAGLAGTTNVATGDPADARRSAERDDSTPTASEPFQQSQKLTADDGDMSDAFGESVAVQNDIALVGAFRDEAPNDDEDEDTPLEDSGAVYVFGYDDEEWTQQAKLTPSEREAKQFFGISVALDGDTALVGAAIDDTSAAETAGTAYVFERSGGTWSQQTKLIASDGNSQDEFGVSVALDDGRALIGARGDETTGERAGSAYVFERSGDAWSQQAKLSPIDSDAKDEFGVSVDLDGATALLGAATDEDPNGKRAGAAYIFEYDGENWGQQVKLLPDDGDSNDFFGRAVALSGSTALVGAFREETNGENAGSAYLFTSSDGNWTQQTKLLADDGDSGDSFGESVALEDDTAIVGARRDDDPHGEDAGSAYVFRTSDGEWTQRTKLVAADGDTDDFFGRSIALDGNTAFFGAVNDEDPNDEGAGSAYVFTRSQNSPPNAIVGDDRTVDGGTIVVLDGSESFDPDGDPVSYTWTQLSGPSVTIADPDTPTPSFTAPQVQSTTDLTFQLSVNDTTSSDTDRLTITVMPARPYDQVAKVGPADGDADDSFGSAVAVSGDVAIVGAPNDEDPHGEGAGAAYILERDGRVWSKQTKIVPADGEPGARFGNAVDISGNVAFVGAHRESGPSGDDAGAVYVFGESEGDWQQLAKLTPDDRDAGDNFGISVTLDDDLAIIGASNHAEPNGDKSGAAYVFAGGYDLWSQQAKLTPDDGDPGDSFGISVALSDQTAAVGAYNDDEPNGEDAGSVYVFQHSDDSWVQQDKLAPTDGDATDDFGQSVVLTGDTLLAGAPDDADPNGYSAGSAYIFERNDSSWAQQQKITPDDGDSADDFGRAVALTGSLIVVGAPNDEDPNGTSAGSVYLYERTEQDWLYNSKLAARDGTAGDAFGFSVAADSDRVFVGAESDTVGSDLNRGSLYVFADRLQLPPVVANRRPRDLDGDGRFEDVTGDGEFDIFDVQALFSNLESDAVQNNAAVYNFSGQNPDTVTLLDVQALYARL